MGWEVALLAFGCLIVGIFYVSLIVYLVCIKQWSGRKADRERFERKVLTHRNSSTCYSSCPTKRSYLANNSDFILVPPPESNISPTTVRSWRQREQSCHTLVPAEHHQESFSHLCDTDDVQSRCSKARSYVVALPSNNSNCGTLRSKIGSHLDGITSDDEITSAHGYKRANSCRGSMQRVYVSRRTLQRSSSCHSAYPEVKIIRTTSCRSCNSCSSSHIGGQTLSIARSNTGSKRRLRSPRRLECDSCDSECSDEEIPRRTRSLDRRSISSRKSYKPTLCDICDL